MTQAAAETSVFDDASPKELSAHLRDLFNRTVDAEAGFVRFLAACQAREVFKSEGATSIAEWMMETFKMSEATAHELLRRVDAIDNH